MDDVIRPHHRQAGHPFTTLLLLLLHVRSTSAHREMVCFLSHGFSLWAKVYMFSIHEDPLSWPLLVSILGKKFREHCY